MHLSLNSKRHTNQMLHLKGYSEYIPLTREKVIRSVKLTYWKEAEWVGVHAEQSGDAIQRFVEESINLGFR